MLVIYIFWKSKASYVPHRVSEVIQVNGSDDDHDHDHDHDNDGTICFQAANTEKL